jgi:hypothetical protein
MEIVVSRRSAFGRDLAPRAADINVCSRCPTAFRDKRFVCCRCTGLSPGLELCRVRAMIRKGRTS